MQTKTFESRTDTEPHLLDSFRAVLQDIEEIVGSENEDVSVRSDDCVLEQSRGLSRHRICHKIFEINVT